MNKLLNEKSLSYAQGKPIVHSESFMITNKTFPEGSSLYELSVIKTAVASGKYFISQNIVIIFKHQLPIKS